MTYSNKKRGTQFERYMCQELAREGWWAHFLSPSAGGSQPFDILAIRGSTVMAIDCKTCSTKWFSYNRIETNQRLAFDLLRKKSDSRKVKCGFMILYQERVIYLPYEQVLEDEKRGKHGYDLRG